MGERCDLVVLKSLSNADVLHMLQLVLTKGRFCIHREIMTSSASSAFSASSMFSSKDLTNLDYAIIPRSEAAAEVHVSNATLHRFKLGACDTEAQSRAGQKAVNHAYGW